MRTILLFPCLLVLSACDDEETPAASKPTGSNVESNLRTPSPTEAAQSSVAYELPFGMPAMPKTRYLHGSSKFSSGSKKRGGEHTTSISYSGKPADIVKFYTKAATERGFENNGGNYQDEGSATLEATNAKGEKFHVYAILGHSKAKEGEARATLIAVKAKPQ